MDRTNVTQIWQPLRLVPQRGNEVTRIRAKSTPVTQWRKHIVCQRARGACQTAVLAISDRGGVPDLANERADDPNSGYRVVGIAIPNYGPPSGEYMCCSVRGLTETQ